MASSSQSFFTENQLKICNKLHRTPKWAQDPKRANTDKKLMTAKVQSYIVELGNHIMNQVDASQQSKAWEFVAERSASKLDSKHLSQLYLDIMQESTATVTEDTQFENIIYNKKNNTNVKCTFAQTNRTAHD